MTTIAIKGKTLAADTQLTLGDDIKIYCQKIHVLGAGEVVAIAGNVDAEFHFKRWLIAGMKPDEWAAYFAELKEPKYEAIYIDRHASRWYFHDGSDCQPIEHRFYAIGSGSKLAMAAMHMGLSAVDAVLLAGDLDVNTNKVIDKYDLVTGKLTKGRRPVSTMASALKEA